MSCFCFSLSAFVSCFLLAFWLALDVLFLQIGISPLLIFLQVQDSKANLGWRSSFQTLFEANMKSTFTFSKFLISLINKIIINIYLVNLFFSYIFFSLFTFFLCIFVV